MPALAEGHKAAGKKVYEVIPERAKVVRDIFQWAKDGLGAREILKTLVQTGVEPFGRKPAWHFSYVRKTLTSPAVYGPMQPCLWQDGKRVPHGDPVLDYFPGVVSREEFEVVRGIMKGRAFVGGGREG